MTGSTDHLLAVSSVPERRYYEAYSRDYGPRERRRARYFCYDTEAGFVAGANVSVVFTFDAPVGLVWDVIQDFNNWANSADYYYLLGNLGRMEGQGFRIGASPADTGPNQYVVTKVIPEFMLVISQPVPEGNDLGRGFEIGHGGVSAGAHVVTLDEFAGTTVVNFFMEHASIMAGPGEATRDEDVLDPWREMTESADWKWRDHFIPAMRASVAERSS
ncbi:hypothetical protein [Pseudonocardia sp. ICBG1293]|uniref:hypothetical protein n=1 Tax=Pseudonocardia sp. ICBG1293 TaxID=2844382 RepID=UPI001CCB383D|nr:hypothetical protein [Pseudonocardia sp. ICBG1293]